VLNEAFKMADGVNVAFALNLPKAELHAHLSGSISVKTMHHLWALGRSQGRYKDLEDPRHVIEPGGDSINLVTFFPLFEKYIHRLIDDVEPVKATTRQVLDDFEADGVRYLELRSTPRGNKSTGLTKAAYVAAVNELLTEWNIRPVNATSEHEPRDVMIARLILCVDRGMTVEEADEVVDLAIQYSAGRKSTSPANVNKHPGVSSPVTNEAMACVVGVDLCGNPTRGKISKFTSAFRTAKDHGLSRTVHFAEVPRSSSDRELSTLLSWEPERLGHIIHVAPWCAEVIKRRKLGLELCLSCNVLAKLTTGGLALHHFGDWRKTDCPIALSVSTRALCLPRSSSTLTRR